jgi:putative N-acetyltransferase (TIGR04045 family)
MSALYCREAANDEEREICYEIRRQVFVEEQKLFSGDDRDEHDDRAIHYAALQKDTIIGTVRIYRDPDGIWWGGRLAVRKRYRGRAGRLLIEACVEHVRREGASHFRAYVQQDNVAFFSTLNWVPIGPRVQICNRPHQLMEAVL